MVLVAHHVQPFVSLQFLNISCKKTKQKTTQQGISEKGKNIKLYIKSTRKCKETKYVPKLKEYNTEHLQERPKERTKCGRKHQTADVGNNILSFNNLTEEKLFSVKVPSSCPLRKFSLTTIDSHLFIRD